MQDAASIHQAVSSVTKVELLILCFDAQRRFSRTDRVGYLQYFDGIYTCGVITELISSKSR